MATSQVSRCAVTCRPRATARLSAKTTIVGRGLVGARSNGVKTTAFFKFGGNDSKKAGIYGSQTRDEYDEDDVEQYFNYMGLLAVEGSYDRIEELQAAGIHPTDILLLLASAEGDVPKVEELLNAGAKADVKDDKGKSAADLAGRDAPAKRDEILALLNAQ